MRPPGVAGALRQRQHLQQQHQRYDIRPCMEPSAESGEGHQDEYKDVTETTDENEKSDGQINVNEGDEEESEEARQGISRKPPVSPSPEELRIHRLTHYPFRSWCPACVAGRAKSWPHQRQQEDDDGGGVPSVSFDYCFLRDTTGGESIPVLVGREKRSKFMVAHVVPYKGAGVDWVVGQLVRDLRKMGIHGKVILKSDQESAILNVLNEVARRRGQENTESITLVESAPKGESQSNGIAERAVQDLEEGTRTHKLDFEAKLKCKIEVTHDIMSWMIENVADIINKFKVGHDGKTAYERLKGKKYKGEFLEFGSLVMHRIPDKLRGGLMTERWIPGVWLGKRSSTDEHVVGLDNGKVVRTRSVRQRPTEDMWNSEEVNKVKGQPWDPSITMTYERLMKERYPMPEEPGTVVQEDVVLKPQSHKIMEKDLRKAGGWTKECRTCEAMRRKDPEANKMSHSDECRRRVGEALAEDKSFKQRLERAMERKSRHVEEREERGRVQEGGATASGHHEPQEPERRGGKRDRDEEGPGDEERVRRGDADDDLDIPMMDEREETSVATRAGPVNENDKNDKMIIESEQQKQEVQRVGGGGQNLETAGKRKREDGDEGDEDRLRQEAGIKHDQEEGERHDGDGDQVMQVSRSSPKGGGMMCVRSSPHQEHQDERHSVEPEVDGAWIWRLHAQQLEEHGTCLKISINERRRAC